MKMWVTALAAGLFVAGQATAATAPSKDVAAAPTACASQWSSMVSAHATGHWTKAKFMRQCAVSSSVSAPRVYATEDNRSSLYAGLAVGGALVIGGIVAIAANSGNGNPVSP